MKVILKKDVADLGEHGALVSVSDGYARNFLLPNGMAVMATKGALKDLGMQQSRLQQKAEKKHQHDLEIAKKIEGVGQLKLTARAGEHGKLFGTVTTRELAKLLTEKTGLEVDRKTLSLDNPINRLGEYKLDIKLSTKVSAKLSILVEADSEEEA